MQSGSGHLKQLAMRPIRELRRKSFPAQGSFETIQRERFLLANILALGITIGIAIISQLLPNQISTGSYLLINILSACWWSYNIHACYTWQRIETLCRLWMCLAIVFLASDSLLGGQITGSSAPLLLLLPVGAALLLRIKDVALISLTTILVIGMIGAAELHSSPTDQAHTIMTDMALLMVTVIASSATMSALVLHQSRVDKALRKSLIVKEHIASHDSLTGLLNRTTITDNLNALNPETDTCNLFLLDLDGFKEINDAYGHDTGDKLLCEVATRLGECMPKAAKIARLGGDEFLMLAPADANGNTLNTALGQCPGKAIIETLGRPILINDLELQVSGSIGISHFPRDARTGETLLKRADLALYVSKDKGRNQYNSFKPHMETAHSQKLSVQNRLRAAISKGDIHLHYQPQICMKTGRIFGFEALARWQDDILGLVMPSDFIPIAEDSGLVVELGENILRRACMEATDWPRLNDGEVALRVSVNISSLQLSRSNFVQRIQSILEETGLPPERLELEITESVLITDPEQVVRTLNALSDLGIAIAMDDFGKGYSSLTYLRNFSLTRLKIDSSFIAGLHEPNGPQIAEAIIQLAKAMNLEVVAEGIETEAQRETLCALGCHYGQGYLFSDSLPQDKILAYTLNHARRYPFKARDLTSPIEPRHMQA